MLVEHLGPHVCIPFRAELLLSFSSVLRSHFARALCLGFTNRHTILAIHRWGPWVLPKDYQISAYLSSNFGCSHDVLGFFSTNLLRTFVTKLAPNIHFFKGGIWKKRARKKMLKMKTKNIHNGKQSCWAREKWEAALLVSSPLHFPKKKQRIHKW